MIETFKDYSMDAYLTGDAYLVGILNFGITAGHIATYNYEATQDLSFIGISYVAKNVNLAEDNIDIVITDGADNVLKQFGHGWYVKEFDNLELYRAKLSAGQKVKVTYYNNGLQDVMCAINLIGNTPR